LQLQYCLLGETYIYYATLTTAFDISTATYTGRISLAYTGITIVSQVTGFHWADANNLFFTDQGSQVLRREYVADYGNDYYINGRSVNSVQSKNLASGSEDFFGISVSLDGYEIRIIDNISLELDIATSSTALDLSGFSITGSAGIATTDTIRDVVYANGDKLFYTIDLTNNLIEKYSVGGAGRGQITMGGILYVVLGSALYSVANTGDATSIGTISNDPENVQMETDGTQLVVCTGDTIYLYTVSGGLTTITDPDIDDTASSSAYMDLRFHYQQPNGQFLASALNDASDINALDFATAESFSDNLVSVHAHNQLLYLMGETFSEIWKTTGVGRPPLARQQVIERGIIGKNAITSIDNKIYFMDQERRVNVMSGAQYEPVVISGLDAEVSDYTIVSDVIFSSYVVDRENFIEMNFPAANRSWTYSERTGKWCKREGALSQRFNAFSYSNIYGKTICLDHSNGKLYELKDSEYQDDGNSITRTIDSIVINSDKLGKPQEKISITRTYVRYNCSSSTVITVSVAKDGNLDDFSQSVSNTVSGSGIITLHRFPSGVCREAIIRISSTSDSKVDILSLAIDATTQKDSND